MENDKRNKSSYVVYLLNNTCNPCTYVGSTNNPIRRIRQHNGQLVGGARYTHRNAPADSQWVFYGHVPGLDKHRALSIEKKVQIRSRRMKDKRAIDRRMRAFQEILEEVGDPDIAFVIGPPAVVLEAAEVAAKKASAVASSSTKPIKKTKVNNFGRNVTSSVVSVSQPTTEAPPTKEDIEEKVIVDEAGIDCQSPICCETTLLQ
jgi:predicted GIY-YIG superfamily endonuclease